MCSSDLHNANRELHVGFYDDEAYTYLLKLQDDDRLNVTLHDTVTFTNVYERKEAQNRREKMRIFQWVCQSAPPGSPVVYSCVDICSMTWRCRFLTG